MNRVEIGRMGERLAKQFLQRRGIRILEQNWRCRSGELDLIGEDQDELVFFEVRSRAYGAASAEMAAESVDVRKQRQVRRVAAVYLHEKQWHDRAIRFDVISVMFAIKQDGHSHEISHISHAF